MLYVVLCYALYVSHIFILVCSWYTCSYTTLEVTLNMYIDRRTVKKAGLPAGINSSLCSIVLLEVQTKP